MNLRHSWNFRQKLAKITEYWAKNVVLWMHFNPATMVKVKRIFSADHILVVSSGHSGFLHHQY
jgi:hypothetical protein